MSLHVIQFHVCCYLRCCVTREEEARGERHPPSPAPPQTSPLASNTLTMQAGYVLKCTAPCLTWPFFMEAGLPRAVLARHPAVLVWSSISTLEEKPDLKAAMERLSRAAVC